MLSQDKAAADVQAWFRHDPDCDGASYRFAIGRVGVRRPGMLWLLAVEAV